jgi:cytochrome c oxidase subunit 4
MNNYPPPKTLLLTLAALLGLLALTLAAAYTNLGPLNTPASLSISAIKAALIILFFMQVRYANRLIWVAVATGIFWLAILFALSLSDFMSRP